MSIPKIPNFFWGFIGLSIFVWTCSYSAKNADNYSVSWEQHIGCSKTKFILQQVRAVVGNATETVRAIIDYRFSKSGSETVNHMDVADGELSKGRDETVPHIYIL